MTKNLYPFYNKKTFRRYCKFSDISQDLLDSCKKMNEFWDEEILPLMEA